MKGTQSGHMLVSMVDLINRGNVVNGWMGLTRRLSSVRSTATPASTLPTVKETSMVGVLKESEIYEVYTFCVCG